MAEARDIALAHYRGQQTIVRRTVNRMQSLWRRLSPGDLDASWATLSAPMVAAVTEGQQDAAGQADGYVAAVIAADGADPQSEGKVNPAAFAGVAADGRPLPSLFYESVIDTRWGLSQGLSPRDAMLRGLEKLLRAAATETADAGRTATGASMAGNRTIQGYVRVVNPPACARCIILAGKEFGWNKGFQRHPRCDCVHLPETLIAKGRGPRRRGGFLDPKDYFNSLSKAEQDRVFTAASAQAIRDGASINSVVNARRGMYTAGAYGRTVRATHEGATRRGAFYRQERRRAIERGLIPAHGRTFRLKTPRLMPEEIYRLADNRSEAIAMLHRFGYLT